MRFLFKMFLVLIFSLPLISCTRNKDKSKVVIQLPAMQESASKPITSFSSGDTSSPWSGSVNDRDQINCYGIFVTGPESELNKHSCVGRQSLEPLFKFGPYVMASPAGSEIELTVPAGKQRSIVLLGMSAPLDLCRDFSSLGWTAESQITYPRILDIETIDLEPGPRRLTLEVPLEVSHLEEVKFCDVFPVPSHGSETVTEWKSVSVGVVHTCAIRLSDDHLFCWGENDYGQLGSGNTTKYLTPTALAAAGGWQSAKWKSVSAGAYHTCGIRLSDNRMFCWGRNHYGQLGTGNTDQQLSPAPLTTVDGWNEVGWKSVSTGDLHTCGIRLSDDHLFCWGFGGGRLGTGDEAEVNPTPRALTSDNAWDETSWKEVAASPHHTCGIRLSDNRIFCWGSGMNGKLGNGSQTSSLVPEALAVAGGWDITEWKSLSTSHGTHTCAIRLSDDQMFCWGRGAGGTLGTGITENQISPVALASLGGWDAVEWKSVNVGAEHTCGIRLSDDRLFCWGIGTNGRLGNGDTVQQLVPASLATIDGWNDVEWKSVSGGGTNTCGIRLSDNRLFCWGKGLRGQLGTGNTNDQNVPAPVVSPEN